MIIEQIPEVQKLSSRQKLILASELWDAYTQQTDPEQDAAIQALLEERMSHFRKDPTSAISWDDLKKMLPRS